tara:strand:- start:1006 stop:1683 length:678 start_codon:yes stop_codon:yes gene_type:complete
MYRQDREILFIHIPKTAGRAVAEVFGVKSHPHLSYIQAESFYNLKSKEKKPYTFAFIRDPHDRFVSCFNQLLDKPYKRSFEKFKNFTPEEFQSWVKLVWFPHYNGKDIQVDDKKMQEWVTSEMDPLSPHGFNPDTYNIWLKNNNSNFNSIDQMLDFRNPLSEMKLLNNNLNSRDSLESISFELSKIRESNLGSYNHFWDSESLDMFNTFAEKDIDFYKGFLDSKV